MKEDEEVAYLFAVMRAGVINTYFGNCQTFVSFLQSCETQVLLLGFSTISVIGQTSRRRVELPASFVVNLIKVLLVFLLVDVPYRLNLLYMSRRLLCLYPAE
jgi:hypothetical protein